MDNRYLHVGFAWKDTTKIDVLEPIFNLADDWIRYAGSNWIIYTNLSLREWAERLRAVLGPNDSVLITELLTPIESDGWMPHWIWNWLNRDRTEPQLILPPGPAIPRIR